MPDRVRVRLPAAPTAVTVERWTDPPPGAGVGTGPCGAGLGDLEELNKTRSALEDGLAKLSVLREQIIHEAEKELLQLAVDIAQKVLAQEIQAERYEIEPIVTEALNQITPGQDVVAHLHPNDWAACESLRQGSENTDDTGSIRFVADPGVRRAECVLETPQGTVVSSVEESIRSVTRALGTVE